MIINDPEAFKSWLTTILEPLCDADPAALAKYVFALVKKDKPINELRASMVEQLDVFLQSETKKFVELLFKTLETQIYDLPATSNDLPVVSTTTTVSQPTPAADTTTPAVSADPPPTQIPVTKQTGEAFVSETPSAVNPPPVTQPVPGHQAVANATPVVNSVQTNGSISVPLHKRDVDLQARGTHRKSDSDKEEKGRSGGRSRHRSSRSPSRGRSRSRSWDRTRRSRSRERDRERERERVRERDRSRAWRNKSPPPRRYDRDRRRSWSRSNSPAAGPGPVARTRSMGTSRSRSRSPRYNHRGRYRNRSPPPGRQSVSRSRSRSTERTREKKEPLSGAGTPTQDSNHGDVDMRLTTTSQSIQSVVSAGGKSNSDNGTSSGPTLLTGIFHAKRRCRDFDEKGYCMRGDLCPYDHGNDPVVLEDVALSRVLAFGPNHPPSHQLAPPGTGPTTPLNPPASSQPPAAAEVTEGLLEHTTTPGIPIEPPAHHLQHPVPHPHMRGPHPGNMEYNPDAPSMEPRMMWGRQPFRGGPAGMRATGMMRGALGRPVLYNPQPQRELISVPVTDQTHNYSTGYKRNRQPPENNNFTSNSEAKGSPPPKKKSNFDFARLGPRHKNPNNCSLELKKVPRGLNNITHLNNHFCKFGKIVNIQVSFEGDPEAALVTFSSHAEANAAYRSTEAVLNNRFIKVFWHNSTDGKQENVPPPRPSVKERLGVPNPVPSSKVLNTLQPKATFALQPEAVEKVIMSGNNLTKTVYIPTALKKQESPVVSAPVVQENTKLQAAAVIKKTQEILAVKETLKKKQEEKRKEAIKLTADLTKRKQDLLDKQLTQQKQLIERLEKGVLNEQRDSVMDTVKKLQESIEKIRKDLSSGVQSGANAVSTTNTVLVKQQKPTSPALVKKSKEEAQREILDAELDLFTRQQEGGDTSELQRKVAELKMEAHSLGLLQGTVTHVRPPHRSVVHVNRSLIRGSNRTIRGSSFRGRGRGFTHVCLDHRPTKLLVSGYEEDEKTEVLAHFSQFGEIVDYIVDDSTPSLILNYKSRKEAEVAIVKGRSFQDRLLSVTWCNNPGVSRSVRGSHNLMSTVHLHHGLGHRSVIMVGANPEGGEELLEEVEEGLIDDEEELGVAELSEDVLLQDDEEEEEDGEDRSWRR